MPNQRLAGLLARSSIEVQARDGIDPARLQASFPPGTEVSITFLPGEDHRAIAAAAAGLARAGYVPMPHVAARALTNRAALDDLLARITGEAGVDRVLVVAGDAPRPRGPFASSLDILQTGALAAHGIVTVAVAGHPEGSPNFPREMAQQALTEKLALIRRAGHAPRVITQFAFEAAPIIDFLDGLAAQGEMPVHVGVAGPATPATLLKFALRCGVGNSVNALRRRAGAIGRLLPDFGPEALVEELAEIAGTRFEAFHIFLFGGPTKAAAWLAAAREGSAPAAGLRGRA
jgi:methylenetetrahydrofolate reductase (NADPH)